MQFPCPSDTTVTFSDDVRSMLRLKSGADEEMNTIVTRHERKLVQFIARMVIDKAVAQELAQEVFLRVYLARHSYEPAAEFTTWLYCIAANHARKWIKRQRRLHQDINALSPKALHRWTAEYTPTPEKLLLEHERHARVAHIINSLPERQKAAVILHKYEGCEYREIARRLDCSVSAVKSILFRTHSTLRGSLQG
ncbi:MAG: RNA polymerase sigma factor [Bryobacteraceae bacterium]